jgi:hypothetical protein
MGRFKIKKISPKQFGNAIKKAGQSVGKQVVNAGKGVATAGKALGKCKVGDVKCAARGVGDIYMATAKLALAASPAGMAYGGINNATGGKLHKGVSAGTKMVIGVDPNEFAKGGITGFSKTLGKAAYKVSGAETLVTSGKALAKCKPKDAKCIAKNLASIGAVAVMYIPGAGGAAAVAMKVGKTAVKGAVQNEIEKIAKAKLAKEKLKRAEEKAKREGTQAAMAQLEVARKRAQQAAIEEKKAIDKKMAAEKQFLQATNVVAQQAVAKEAFEQQEKASKMYPEIASQVAADLKPGDAAAQADAATATTIEGTKAVLASQNEIAKGIEKLSEEPVYFGIPQSKFIMIGIAIFFFLMTIMILKP